MSQPIVSFVVPCYNYGRYVRDCLDGILALEGGYEIEIIVVNDASTDDTMDVVATYTDSRIRVIDRKVNRGHAYTVNEGLSASSGRYVVRIDPDDRHRPNFLSATVPMLEAHPEVGMVYGNVALMDPEGRVTQSCADVAHEGRDFKGNELIPLLGRNYVCAPSVIARREAWMGGWPCPEWLAFNDWYYTILMARRWEFYYVNEVVADYRVHSSNHHTKVSRDGSEERSVLWLLGKVYGETESDPALESAKRKARPSVYASHYLDFATKYFGHHDSANSRRCYLAAIHYRPTLLFDRVVMRRLFATLVPRVAYERAKLALRRAA
jgi:glycosyltransferase involved in cell wall biosynthesis